MPRDALRRDGQPEFSAARGGLRRDPDPPARHRLEGYAGQEKSQAAVGAVGNGVSAIPLHGYRPPQRDVQLDHDIQDYLRLLPALRPVPPGD